MKLSQNTTLEVFVFCLKKVKVYRNCYLYSGPAVQQGCNFLQSFVNKEIILKIIFTVKIGSHLLLYFQRYYNK